MMSPFSQLYVINSVFVLILSGESCSGWNTTVGGWEVPDVGSVVDCSVVSADGEVLLVDSGVAGGGDWIGEASLQDTMSNTHKISGTVVK